MIALVFGVVAGLGLWLVLVGLLPPRPTLAETLMASLAPQPVADPIVARADAGWASRAGRPMAGFLAGFGLPRQAVRRDLAVMGRPVPQHLAEQAVGGLFGFTVPLVMAAILAGAGLGSAAVLPLWASLGFAAVGFVLPDLLVRADANAYRAEFRHCLAAFLDLVVVSLAGGSGVDGALADASSVGTGWSFQQIRRALRTARLTRVPPWATLARLGDELGVAELQELAASVSLAGSEGARVRASLTAKAAALRAHQLSEAEGDAQSATEQMSLPIVVMMTGFLAFIGYPALISVTTAL